MDVAKKVKYQCESCKKVFNRSARLTSHTEKGCNRTTYVCDTCHKNFQDKYDLERYQKNADPKVCDVCSTTFCHESELERHKRAEHIDQWNHAMTCDTCSKKFSKNLDLERHQKNADPKVCDVCSITFCHESELERHKKTQHVGHGSRTTCGTCRKKFPSNRDLQTHQRNADPKLCDVCSITFCHESELERHKRTEHVGEGIATDENNSDAISTYKIDLSQPIYPQLPFEKDEAYKEVIARNWGKIRSWMCGTEYTASINRKLTPNFTYKDLRSLLIEIIAKRGIALKINIGFGFVLLYNLTGEYRYYYPSSNNFLFDRLITISNNRDLKRLMKRIMAMDLAESYYMKRPSSGLILVTLPNILIEVVYLTNIVYG